MVFLLFALLPALVLGQMFSAQQALLSRGFSQDQIDDTRGVPFTYNHLKIVVCGLLPFVTIRILFSASPSSRPVFRPKRERPSTK